MHGALSKVSHIERLYVDEPNFVYIWIINTLHIILFTKMYGDKTPDVLGIKCILLPNIGQFIVQQGVDRTIEYPNHTVYFLHHR